MRNVRWWFVAVAVPLLVLDGAPGAQAGSIGVQLQDAGPGQFLVVSVVANSPGAQAGLKAGDLIIAVQGKRPDSLADFVAWIRGLPPGTQVYLALFRENWLLFFTVTLGL